jgi:hypothetical protein
MAPRAQRITSFALAVVRPLLLQFFLDLLRLPAERSIIG